MFCSSLFRNIRSRICCIKISCLFYKLNWQFIVTKKKLTVFASILGGLLSPCGIGLFNLILYIYIYNLDGNAFVLIWFWRCDCESGEKEEKKPEWRRKKEKKKEKKMKEPVRWREKVKKKKTKSHVWAQVLSWMSDRGFYKVTIFTIMSLKLSFYFP